ncbi:MAG: proteasome assembly chaperone family protein [Candidatus Nanoarchaeia archaeon]
MFLQFKKKPKGVTVIEGFPGFGLVGTITTEYMLDHLKCEKIGTAYFEELPSTVAIHKGGVLDPVGIYYSKKFNLVIIHSVAAMMGIEWKAADLVNEICKQLKAKHIYSIEGVGSPPRTPSSGRVFYYSTKKSEKKRLKIAKVDPLGEGVIIGVTAACLLKSNLPMTCLFAEVAGNLPDSKAAAEVIKVLDFLLKMKVDPKPLIKKAEEFEAKLHSLMEQAQKTQESADKKQLSYVG